MGSRLERSGMSYDLNVYGTTDGDIASVLTEADGWEADEDSWTLSKRSWQIIVSFPERVEFDEIPDEARDLRPGTLFHRPDLPRTNRRSRYRAKNAGIGG